MTCAKPHRATSRLDGDFVVSSHYPWWLTLIAPFLAPKIAGFADVFQKQLGEHFGHTALRMSGATSPYYYILYFEQAFLLACHLILLVNGKLILCSQAMAFALLRQCSRCLSSSVGMKITFSLRMLPTLRHALSFTSLNSVSIVC